MKFKTLLPVIAALFFLWIFYWALFVPKEDVSGRIYNSLKEEEKKGLGYWFKAKNLRWRLSDQKLFCQGGIMLNKGDAAAYAETLSGDVEFKKMELSGSPRIVIGPAGSIPVTLEAESFEITGRQDIFTASGNPRIKWQDATVTAKTAQYYQQKKKLKLSGEVVINFRDIKAW